MLIGRSAPGFKAPAFHKGEVTSIDLEKLRGKWVVLCFYPGDFTFV